MWPPLVRETDPCGTLPLSDRSGVIKDIGVCTISKAFLCAVTNYTDIYANTHMPTPTCTHTHTHNIYTHTHIHW